MYQPFQINTQVAQQAATQSQGYGSGKTYRRFKIVTAGTHVVRVLPPYSSEGLLGVKTWDIWNVPDPEKPGESTKHVCVEMTFPERGVRCPIIEVMQRYQGAGLDAFFEKLKPSPNAYMNVLVRSTVNINLEKYPVDPMLATIMQTQHLTLDFVYSKCMDADYGNITDPMSGRDLKLTKQVKNQKTSYEREVKPSVSPLFADQQQIQMALDSMYNLSEIYKFPDDRIFGRIIKSAQLLEDKIKYLLSASAPPQVPVSNMPPQQQFAQQYAQQPVQNTFDSFPNPSVAAPNTYQQPQQQFVAQPPVAQVQPQPTPTAAPYVAPSQPVQQQVFPQQDPVSVSGQVQMQPPPPVVQQQQPLPQQQVQPQPTHSSAIAQSSTQPATVSPLDAELQALGVRRPDASPTCFADDNVFSSSRKECQICIYDMECTTAIGKRKGQ